MLLTTWLRNTFKHVTLCEQIMNSQGVLVKVPNINVDLTAGLFSTDSKEEYQELCMKYAPLGTILDEITDDWYRDKLLRARNILTRMALTERNTGVAKKYLEILERRDKSRWQKEAKEVKATAVDSEGKKVEIVISDY